MKTLAYYKSGFNGAFRSLPMMIMIYLYYLAIALLLAVPFYSLLKAAGGNSLLPQELLKGFDATAIREILASGGRSFLFFTKALLPWAIAFLLLQAFLAGGMLGWLSNPRGKFSVRQFHVNAFYCFFRFLKLTLWILLLHALPGVLVYLNYFLIMGGKESITDKEIVGSFTVTLVIHSLLLIFLMMVSDLAKSRLYEQDSGKALKSLWRSLKLIITSFPVIYGLAILLIIPPVLFVIAFYFVRSGFTAGSLGTVILVFFLQQFFILARIFFRVWRLSSAYRCYIGYTQILKA